MYYFNDIEKHTVIQLSIVFTVNINVNFYLSKYIYINNTYPCSYPDFYAWFSVQYQKQFGIQENGL
jgi:hypothetical protein